MTDAKRAARPGGSGAALGRDFARGKSDPKDTSPGEPCTAFELERLGTPSGVRWRVTFRDSPIVLTVTTSQLMEPVAFEEKLLLRRLDAMLPRPASLPALASRREWSRLVGEAMDRARARKEGGR